MLYPETRTGCVGPRVAGWALTAHAGSRGSGSWEEEQPLRFSLRRLQGHSKAHWGLGHFENTKQVYFHPLPPKVISLRPNANPRCWPTRLLGRGAGLVAVGTGGSAAKHRGAPPPRGRPCPSKGELWELTGTGLPEGVRVSGDPGDKEVPPAMRPGVERRPHCWGAGDSSKTEGGKTGAPASYLCRASAG